MNYFVSGLYYRIKFRGLKRKLIIEPQTDINRHCTFEGMNRICRKSRVVNSYMGYASYVGVATTVISTKIGRYCSIGPGVRVTSGIHPTRQFVSTHPAFFSIRGQCGVTYTEKQLFDEHPKPNDGYQTVIGNDVWIGDSAMIIEGVTVGDGAIIGAGAVVTRDVPDYAIVLGIPAKVVRYRFAPEQIAFLQQLKWWNKDTEWVAQNAHLFTDIDLMMKEL